MKIQTFSLLLICSMLSTACQSQEPEDALQKIDRRLKSRETTITKVLGDTSLMHLHSQSSFREMIRNNAREGWFSMITADEPGTRITIKGQVINRIGAPLPNVTVYVYQTSAKGWYTDKAPYRGDSDHARLFAYFKTDAQGQFAYETIKPGGYPGSEFAAHIHLGFWDKNGNVIHDAPGELQFEDDPRMTPTRKQLSLAEGCLIAGNSGTVEKPVYNYQIKLGK